MGGWRGAVPPGFYVGRSGLWGWDVWITGVALG